MFVFLFAKKNKNNKHTHTHTRFFNRGIKGAVHTGTNIIISGGVADWLTCRISKLRIADRVGSNTDRDSRCFIEQETLFIAKYCMVGSTNGFESPLNE
jgi:hypothetical protein